METSQAARRKNTLTISKAHPQTCPFKRILQSNIRNPALISRRRAEVLRKRTVVGEDGAIADAGAEAALLRRRGLPLPHEPGDGRCDSSGTARPARIVHGPRTPPLPHPMAAAKIRRAPLAHTAPACPALPLGPSALLPGSDMPLPRRIPSSIPSGVYFL